MNAAVAFMQGAIARMRTVKGLGDGVLAQVSEAELFHTSDAEANSIAIVVRHLRGNMLSRWTNFLTTDGDKPDRNRDCEFEQPGAGAASVHQMWEDGWACTMGALESLTAADMLKTVTVRGEPMTVIDAIIRQMSHYSYHVGQMVTLGRAQMGTRWKTLSIARGKSADYKPKLREGGIKE